MLKVLKRRFPEWNLSEEIFLKSGIYFFKNFFLSLPTQKL